MELRAAAADLLDGFAAPERVRAFVGPGLAYEGQTPIAGFDRPLWEAMATQGWLGIERPEEADGLGLGMVEVAVLCEELGRRAAPAPFVGSILCLGALERAAAADALTPPAREAALDWAQRLATGEAVGCVGAQAGPGFELRSVFFRGERGENHCGEGAQVGEVTGMGGGVEAGVFVRRTNQGRACIRPKGARDDVNGIAAMDFAEAV